MQTERVTFLTSPTRKTSLAARAAAYGVSMGEYVRRKVEDDDAPTDQQEAELAVLVEEANEAIPKMAASIDRMCARLEKSNREMDAFLRQVGVRG